MRIAAAQRPEPSARRPRASRRAAPRSHPGPVPGLPNLTGFAILVVEDHADSRELLRQVLEPLGARVVLAANGYDALAVLRNEPRPPDVILCDLLMPAMDGLSLVRRLQQEPEWRSIPVVAVTALGQLADYIMTWTHGFQAHLTKPVDPILLADVVRRFARRPSPGRGRRPETPDAGR